MKKAVAFILAFMYLGLSSGLAVNIHYCMGKVTDVDVNNYSDKSCVCKMKEGSMPCCGHFYELVKVNDEHQVVASSFSFTTPEITVHTFDNLMALLTLPQTCSNISAEHIPPLLSPPDILYSELRLQNLISYFFVI
jgi:hypothetical protein